VKYYELNNLNQPLQIIQYNLTKSEDGRG